MPVKLIAFDLDGTALLTNKTISDKNRSSLEKAGNAGILLVPATGRLLSFLPPEVTSIPHVRYVITANGGAVYDLREQRKLHSACLTTDKAQAIQRILDEYSIYTEYYVDGVAFTTEKDVNKAKITYGLPESKYHFLTKKYSYVHSFTSFLQEVSPTPEKINLPYLPAEIRDKLRARLERVEGIKLTSSIADNLEINDSTATKGLALCALCAHLEISPQSCMAIGDNGNDEDMLRYAGVSVAMANSSDEAFRAAKYRTLSCENSGLALAIEKYAL
ncbi:MAG: HAD family hydrolase [Oscillospiraceae bacterium]